MIFKFVVSDEAANDLEDLFETDEDSAAEIQAFLEQVEADQSLLDTLTVHKFGQYGTENVHVKKWATQQRNGRNMWRLKLWDLEDKGIQYRVFYAFDNYHSTYYVLGICSKRVINYDDPNSMFHRRLVAAYDRLGIRDISARR